ncbi:hypothetical protein, partial [Pseudomonas syringae]|uniref:hypothetical protein n=1 Tax=Pseudomonas syringae TaxID=317 RepID=UPI00398F1FD8
LMVAERWRRAVLKAHLQSLKKKKKKKKASPLTQRFRERARSHKGLQAGFQHGSTPHFRHRQHTST